MKKQRKKDKDLFFLSRFNSNGFSSDDLVDQVLNELNITMANQIPGKLFHVRYRK